MTKICRSGLCILAAAFLFMGCNAGKAPSDRPQSSMPASPSENTAPHSAASPEPSPYSDAWLQKYSPASVAGFEEQVGDNGNYTEVSSWPPPDTYKLVVDYNNQCVFAYSKDASGNDERLARVMLCTTGDEDHPSPLGDFTLGSERIRFGYFTEFDCYAQYWTQVEGDIYFHSVLYAQKDASTLIMDSYENLGSPVSHGCIRLSVPDARWIFENCAPGTACGITKDLPEDGGLRQAIHKGYSVPSAQP